MMFTGTSQQQDTRFSDKEKKLLKEMKFGDTLNKRVDMTKVKLEVLRPWISKRITEILHIEDDVVTEFVYNQLEENKFPCPKKMQINMTGFLNGPNARQFMVELWSLLLAAQSSKNGIPPEFLEQKKDEITKREEPVKIPKDYRPNALSSTHRERIDRRLIVDNVTGGGDSDNGNTMPTHFVSKNIDNHNNTKQKEHDSRQESPNALKVCSDSLKDTSEKIDLNVDIENKYHKKLSAYYTKEEHRQSKSRKLTSSQRDISKSPKVTSLHRHSRERSTGRKTDRYRNSPSCTSFNRNYHSHQKQHYSRYKDYRRSRSRSRRASVRARRRNSRSRQSQRYLRKKSSTPRKRRYSHSRQRGRSSRSNSRRNYKAKSFRRSSSTHKAINSKQNGSDDRYVSNTTKNFNQRDIDLRRNRQASPFSENSNANPNDKHSSDWQQRRSNEGLESHRRHSSLDSYPASQREHNNKRSLSQQGSISLSPEPIRNNNIDYKLYAERENQRCQSQQRSQQPRHSKFQQQQKHQQQQQQQQQQQHQQHQQQQQQEQQRYCRSGLASSVSSGEYIAGGIANNRINYFEHQGFTYGRCFPRGSWETSHNKNDDVRERSVSSRDPRLYRHSSQSVTTNQSTTIDQYGKNYSSEYQYQQQQICSGSRDRSYNNNNFNIDNTQLNHYYNGNRRSDNTTYGYISSRDRNISPSSKYGSKRIDAPIRQRDLTSNTEYRYSRDQQPVLSTEQREIKGQKNDEWNNQTRNQKKLIADSDNDMNVTNTESLREDSFNKKKSNQSNDHKEQISTVLSDAQKSRNDVDKCKSNVDRKIKNIDSSSVTTIPSDNSDTTEMNSYRDKLRKRVPKKSLFTEMREKRRIAKLSKKSDDAVIITNDNNAKEDNSEKIKTDKMETDEEIFKNTSNIDESSIDYDRSSLSISQLPLSEATAATEAASASLAATLEAALAGSSGKQTTQLKTATLSQTKQASSFPVILPLQPAPPYRFNRQTTSLSRSPSPFLKVNHTLINWEKALIRTMYLKKGHGKKKKRRWVDSKNASDVSSSESKSDDDDDSDDDSDETDDSNKVSKGISKKRKHKSSAEEKRSQSNCEANKRDKILYLQQKDDKKKNAGTTDESDCKKKLSTSSLKKYTKKGELTHESIDKPIRIRSKCNFSALTQEQEYTIAAIMALRKTEKRKRNDKSSNVAEINYLQNEKFWDSDSEDSDYDDRFERTVREKVLRNAQKYQRCALSNSSELAIHGKNSPKLGGFPMLAITSNQHLSSPLKKQKKLMKKPSNIKNADESCDVLTGEYDDADIMTKKKSHKKHKKHSSKKSRKNKKHKKKDKCTSIVASSSDDDNEDDDIVDIDDNSSISTIDENTKRKNDTNLFIRNPSNSNLLGNVKASSINEDLERQLRERALKSMKKN